MDLRKVLGWARLRIENVMTAAGTRSQMVEYLRLLVRALAEEPPDKGRVGEAIRNIDELSPTIGAELRCAPRLQELLLE